MKKILLIISAMMVLFSCGKKEAEKTDGGKQGSAMSELKPESGATLKVKKRTG